MSDGTAAPAVVTAGTGTSRALPGRDAWVTVRIDREHTGCRNLVQRIFELLPGGYAELREPTSEDVAYVISGHGRVSIGGRAVTLTPGTGFLAPMDVPYRITADGERLLLVSVLSPQPGRPGTVAPATVDAAAEPWVHESDREVIAAGDDPDQGYLDRSFKVLVDPAHGAHYVTQFIGCIERSKAPFHTHTYEEVITILEGTGLVHIAGGTHPLTPGTSVYLPPGTPHCLENPNETPLGLLGVFCPAGSPKNRQAAPEPTTG